MISHLPGFHEHRSFFPPSTATRCLSSPPHHGAGFHIVGFWDQSWGLWPFASCLGRDPEKAAFALHVESPGLQNGGDCFLTGSSVVSKWEEVNVNVFFAFLFPSPSHLPHSLFFASACFLTLVSVWASAAVIISRQGLTETNAYARRHKDPQHIGPQDECCGFRALDFFSYV